MKPWSPTWKMQPRNRSLIQALNESNKCETKQRKQDCCTSKKKGKDTQKEITKNERDMKYFSDTVVKSESLHLRSTIGFGCDVWTFGAGGVKHPSLIDGGNKNRIR